ncbi:GNAT family N-acetyltransferase [Paenibacillus sp. UASWS1643]|uniref:GNAT family N-acetyltransferase n=1 Tax=Paenibacillus sp. UASWS1643 TaxID=2580422 RepID=UPI0012399CEB|nr:GNAT family N-acetyltransferase [Paenibacillus sp. UASWS1643]KAA8745372.1 GNAT family N-acetyltransferase [Paenibacillus sp. UASWS1643]
MYTIRELKTNDLSSICSFPQNEEELIFSFPKVVFPLTPDQIIETITSRLKPTVVLHNNNVIAFACLYDVQENTCSLGNVIVSSEYRGKGVAVFLLQTISTIAKEEYKVETLQLVCQNINTRGLIFYKKQGFNPVDLFWNQRQSGEYVVGIRMQKSLISI